jgi:hypothetical protein
MTAFVEEDGGSMKEDFSDESYNCMRRSQAWDTHLRTCSVERHTGEDAQRHGVEVTTRSKLEGGVVGLELWKLGKKKRTHVRIPWTDGIDQRPSGTIAHQ